jgi:hypothetical protein
MNVITDETHWVRLFGEHVNVVSKQGEGECFSAETTTQYLKSKQGYIDLNDVKVSVGQNVNVKLNLMSEFIKQTNQIKNNEKKYKQVGVDFIKSLKNAENPSKIPQETSQSLSDALRK